MQQLPKTKYDRLYPILHILSDVQELGNQNNSNMSLTTGKIVVITTQIGDDNVLYVRQTNTIVTPKLPF